MSSASLERGPGSVYAYQGYGRLASFLAEDKDRSTSIYRGFHRVTTRNLLYLESELAELEARQDTLDNVDSNDLENLAGIASWEVLSRSTREIDREKLELLKEIRRVTREYQEALLLQEACLKLPPPEKRSLAALRHWCSDAIKDGGEKIPVVEGRAAARLDDENDLVALHVSPDQDRLTKLVRQRFGVLFATQGETGMNDSIVTVSEKRISQVVAAISSTIAAILLIGAVVNLYLVTKASTRLWLIGVYMTGFALSLTLLTNARRPEIFAATAAYTAVLVVFISGNLGSK